MKSRIGGARKRSWASSSSAEKEKRSWSGRWISKIKRSTRAWNVWIWLKSTTFSKKPKRSISACKWWKELRIHLKSNNILSKKKRLFRKRSSLRKPSRQSMYKLNEERRRSPPKMHMLLIKRVIELCSAKPKKLLNSAISRSKNSLSSGLSPRKSSDRMRVYVVPRKPMRNGS